MQEVSIKNGEILVDFQNKIFQNKTFSILNIKRYQSYFYEGNICLYIVRHTNKLATGVVVVVLLVG